MFDKSSPIVCYIFSFRLWRKTRCLGRADIGEYADLTPDMWRNSRTYLRTPLELLCQSTAHLSGDTCIAHMCYRISQWLWTEIGMKLVVKVICYAGWKNYVTWWRHDMETFWALLALHRGIHRWLVDFLHKGPMMGSFTLSFVVRQNKLLSKAVDELLIWDSMTPCKVTVMGFFVCSLILRSHIW